MYGYRKSYRVSRRRAVARPSMSKRGLLSLKKALSRVRFPKKRRRSSSKFLGIF